MVRARGSKCDDSGKCVLELELQNFRIGIVWDTDQRMFGHPGLPVENVRHVSPLLLPPALPWCPVLHRTPAEVACIHLILTWAEVSHLHHRLEQKSHTRPSQTNLFTIMYLEWQGIHPTVWFTLWKLGCFCLPDPQWFFCSMGLLWMSLSAFF